MTEEQKSRFSGLLHHVVWWLKTIVSEAMQCIHFLDHKFQPWRWRQHGLQNVGFQPPNYKAQKLRKPWFLFLCHENLKLHISICHIMWHEAYYREQFLPNFAEYSVFPLTVNAL